MNFKILHENPLFTVSAWSCLLLNITQSSCQFPSEMILSETSIAGHVPGVLFGSIRTINHEPLQSDIAQSRYTQFREIFRLSILLAFLSSSTQAMTTRSNTVTQKTMWMNPLRSLTSFVSLPPTPTIVSSSLVFLSNRYCVLHLFLILITSSTAFLACS